ncbi:MAG: hypothetical protein IKL59_06090 [Clostridia bacterium]|nr:hypothetical protein [Clostridia bacterium]
MRKKSPILVIIISFVVCAIVAFTYMALTGPLPSEYYIFQNIEECENLIPTDMDDESFERYDMPMNDKDLDSLSYNNFFGGSFKSDSLQYEIFAYEFEDYDSALKYYANVVGQNFNSLKELERDSFFLASQGTSYQLVVILQNKAYKLNAPNKYIDEINELLANTFSQKIN